MDNKILRNEILRKYEAVKNTFTAGNARNKFIVEFNDKIYKGEKFHKGSKNYIKDTENLQNINKLFDGLLQQNNERIQANVPGTFRYSDIKNFNSVKLITDNIIYNDVITVNSDKIYPINGDRPYGLETHKIRFNTVLKETRKIMNEKTNYIVSQKVEFFNRFGENINAQLNYLSDEFINVLNVNYPGQRPIIFVQGENLNGEIQEALFNFLNRKFIHTVLKYSDIDKINFDMTDNYFYEWYVKDFLNFFYPDGYVTITTTSYRALEKLENMGDIIKQTFMKDNENACLFNGLFKFFESKKDNDKNAKANYNYLKREDVQEEYFKPCKEEDLENINSNVNKLLQKLKTSVTIKDLVKGNNNDKHYKTPYAKYNATFLNTKYNHLDLLNHNYNEVEEIERVDYDNLKNNLNYYIEKFGQLLTIDKTYKIKNSDFQNSYKKWKEENNYDSLNINVDSPEYNLIENYDYVLHTFFNKNMKVDNKLYIELDLKKAYYNYVHFNNYVGVPSGNFITINCRNFKMSDYEELSKNKLIGYFQIEITKTTEKLEFLGFKVATIHLLTSPMINILKNHIEFNFINCCYAPSVHIPFNEDMLKKEDGLSYYCKIFGLMLKSTDEITTTIKPLEHDINYFSLINDDNYKMYLTDDGLIKIKDNDYIKKSKIHIGYFIHSYTRCQILEQLLKMDISKIYGVKLDSIVIDKNYEFDYDKNVFGLKNANIENMLKIGSLEISGYYRPYFEQNDYIPNYHNSFLLSNDIVKNRVVFIGGQGGSGKSYSILNNNILNRNNICYTTNSWNLIQGQKNKYYGIRGYSLPNLTGKCGNFSTEKIHDNNIKYIFIDEATLIDEKIIKQIINDYKNCFIFIAGDVDYDGFFYQCSLNDIKLFVPKNNNCQYVTYKKSYRFDNNLNNKLNGLREVMREKDMIKMLSYIREEFEECFYDKNDIVFNDNDIGISALKDCTDITLYFLNKGTKPQYFIKDTKKEKGQLKGQQLAEKPDHDNYEMKLFKSIHSFQGLDLDYDNNIIIHIAKNFDFNLYYTALSRARRIDQIKIIY